jgi:hypothetical protein
MRSRRSRLENRGRNGASQIALADIDGESDMQGVHESQLVLP